MPDPKLFIIVEGKTDATAIRVILGNELARQTRLFAAQGRTSLVTVARNVYFHEGGPVLIVMDADTTTPTLVQEQKAMTRAALETLIPSVTNEDRRVRVFAFVPEIEVIFFEAPQALERLLGEPIPPEAVQEGLLLPSQILDALFRQKGSLDKMSMLYAPLLNPEIANLLAQGKQATALRETVSSMLAPAVPTT
jgi:hypothetical protein